MSLPVYELGARSQNEEVLSKEAFGAPVVFEVQLLPLRSTSPSRRDLKMSEPPTVKEIGEVASRSDATEGTGQMTTFSVALIMTTTALGAGLLHFPAAYNIAGGIIMATVLQLILVVSIGGTILTLAFCADVKKDRTYHGILLSMCGKKWRYASAVSVLLTCYGVCVTYLIVIGDQYDRIFASLHGPDFCHTWYMAREFTITLTAAAIVLPLNMLQHIEFLKYASSLGLAAVIYPCVLTCIAYFTERRPDNLYIKVWPTNVRDVFLSTPVFCFAYLGCNRGAVPGAARKSIREPEGRARSQDEAQPRLVRQHRGSSHIASGHWCGHQVPWMPGRAQHICVSRGRPIRRGPAAHRARRTRLRTCQPPLLLTVTNQHISPLLLQFSCVY
ncbi:sodium-coupled neutral amino acid transporter 7 isoform X4 [Rhipicephalus microplus]|uniref:sodium-coupled neutral amino acid transporter 7 isoform X4 n=1 Tax=Rhipicephalus microplus TaxID=6941 RepID=UPI003F6CE58A